MSSNAVRAGAAFVELFAEDSKLVRGLRSASARIKKWADDTQKRMRAFGQGLFDAGKWTFGIGAGLTGSLLAVTSQFASEGDKFDKMAVRTGMTAEALSELGYAAVQCGSSIETVEGSVHKMQVLLAEAGKGSEVAAEKLAALGLTYDDLKSKSPEPQFRTLVSRLKGVKDDGQRAALTMAVFGKSAHELLPLINAGSVAIDAMRAESRQLGVSMAGPDAAAAAEYVGALTRLYALFRGIANHIGAALAPELTNLVNWFVKGVSPLVQWIDKNRELIVTLLKWSGIVAGIGAGLMVAGGAVIGFGIAIGALGTMISAVFATVGTVLAGAGAVVGFLLTPIGAVLTALAGFGAYFLYTSGLADDAVLGMRDAFMALFETATKAWQGISDALAAGRLDLVFKVAWTAIKLVWTQGVNFLHEKWLWVADTIRGIWADTVYGTGDTLVRAWAGIQATWTETVYAMQHVWAGFSKGVVDAWKTAERYVARGIAWIYAKLSGMDAAEMVKIVDEGYDAQQKRRDEKNTAYLDKIGVDRQRKLDKIETEKTATLDALRDDYARKQGDRQSAHQKQLDDLDAARVEAEKEFNDAVKEAADVRTRTEEDAKAKNIARRAQEAAVTTAIKETKFSSTGTFNAAAVQGLQAQGPMDRIAKATEATEKNTKKLVEQDRIARAG